jgi:hypothetical protein
VKYSNALMGAFTLLRSGITNSLFYTFAHLRCAWNRYFSLMKTPQNGRFQREKV